MARIRHDINLLWVIIERDKCTLNIDSYTNIAIGRDSLIDFVCNCGTKDHKKFRSLYKVGAFCKGCTKKTSVINLQNTMIEKYGVNNAFKLKNIKEKIKQTHLKNRGIEHHMKIKEIRDQIKQTNLKKYGTEYATQADTTKEKTKQTNIKKYGKHPSKLINTREKCEQTSLDRYGSKCSLLAKSVKEKTKKTNIEKYGVEHIFQNETMYEKAIKAGYKRKEFTYPDGSIIFVQGYEPIALRQLLDIGYTKDDITTGVKNVPKIWYIGEDNKNHRYYCDIYINSENLIIEVKSKYTYESRLQINTLKAKACKEAGYKFEFWIVKDQDIDVIKPF